MWGPFWRSFFLLCCTVSHGSIPSKPPKFRGGSEICFNYHAKYEVTSVSILRYLSVLAGEFKADRIACRWTAREQDQRRAEKIAGIVSAVSNPKGALAQDPPLVQRDGHRSHPEKTAAPAAPPESPRPGGSRNRSTAKTWKSSHRSWPQDVQDNVQYKIRRLPLQEKMATRRCLGSHKIEKERTARVKKSVSKAPREAMGNVHSARGRPLMLAPLEAISLRGILPAVHVSYVGTNFLHH